MNDAWDCGSAPFLPCSSCSQIPRAYSVTPRAASTRSLMPVRPTFLRSVSISFHSGNENRRCTLPQFCRRVRLKATPYASSLPSRVSDATDVVSRPEDLHRINDTHHVAALYLPQNSLPILRNANGQKGRRGLLERSQTLIELFSVCCIEHCRDPLRSLITTLPLRRVPSERSETLRKTKTP